MCIRDSNCTVESTKENKAFLNIKNSTQSYDVTLSGTNTVNGLTANGTTGSALYQVETTEVTETTGKPVTVKQENKAGELETVYEVKKTEKAYVAEVNGVKYDSLQAAIDAASRNATVTMLADTRENVTISTNYLTLDLNGHTLNGGTVAGLSAIFATTHECLGIPVTSIFDPSSLPDYASFDSRDCPMCKAGQHIDALVNSFGYSAL